MAALAAIVSALHVLAVAIGLPAIVLRWKWLRGPLDETGQRRVFAADSAWGIAAFLWLATGPLRAFGPLEKGPAFYLASRLFHLKLGLFLLVLLLELMPMVGLIQWRMAVRRGVAADTSKAGVYATLSAIETVIVVAIVFVAAFMARGFGLPHS